MIIAMSETTEISSRAGSGLGETHQLGSLPGRHLMLQPTLGF